MTRAPSSISRTWRRRPKTPIAPRARRATRWRWTAAGLRPAASSPGRSWAASTSFAHSRPPAFLAASGLFDDFLAYIGDLARARGRRAAATLGARAVGAARADETCRRSERIRNPGDIEHCGGGTDRFPRGLRHLRLATVVHAGVGDAGDDSLGVDAMRAQRGHQVDAD